MNNTYPIEYTGDEVVKLLKKIDELTKSMGLEIIVSPDKATKPGVYAIEGEAVFKFLGFRVPEEVVVGQVLRVALHRRQSQIVIAVKIHIPEIHITADKPSLLILIEKPLVAARDVAGQLVNGNQAEEHPLVAALDEFGQVAYVNGLYHAIAQ